MGMVQMNDEALTSILKLISNLISAGPAGWAVGGALLVIALFFYIKYRQKIHEMIRQAVIEARRKAQANNQTNNERVENDTAKSEQEIEEIIKNRDNH
jgi:hypothetical protein